MNSLCILYMKKKCLECVILILLFFALTHGITRTTIQPSEKNTEVQTEYREHATQISIEQEQDLQALTEKIAASGTRKFYQGYPVDEAFINWKGKKKFYQYLADNSRDIGLDENGCVYSYKITEKASKTVYAYTSGRRYGQHFDDVDLDLKSIDIVGNLQ